MTTTRTPGTRPRKRLRGSLDAGLAILDHLDLLGVALVLHSWAPFRSIDIDDPPRGPASADDVPVGD
jgi:hypothetical protein